MWIDAHAHLSGLSAGDLGDQLDEARSAGIGAVLCTATDAVSSRMIVKQCAAWPMLYGAAGISPFDVEHVPDFWYDELSQILTNKKMVAVGEIGIDDTNSSYPPIRLQQQVFERQLDITKKAGVPAVIHSRGAEEMAVAICKTSGIENAVFHCFTGNHQALAAVLDNGYYVSISGIVTFRNSELRKHIRDIPADRLLIETDCPYLAPVPHRGKANRPAWVRYTGEEIARLLVKPAEEVEAQIEKNFRRIFRKVGMQQDGTENDVQNSQQ